MSACPKLTELFDAALRRRATGPVLVKRPVRRVQWEDREQVDKLMRQRPEAPRKGEDGKR
jgi:hypothetical protein